MLDYKIKNHPVAIAVAPLRQAAIDMAEESAKNYIEHVKNKLAEHGWDFNKAYPYPKTHDRNYRFAVYVMQEARRLVTEIGERNYMPNAPKIVEMDEQGCEKYIEDEKDGAAESYDHYVHKLVGKIGECEKAELEENGKQNLWRESYLRVTKPDKTERWHTQMIYNRSKHGKHFVQFPTRLKKR